MSSLAAARADNFYFPPEWTPDKGSINKFQKSHPLGKRAKKIGQGILVIRFEMPYHIWCLGCDKHIGRGTRYNAEKKRAGNYFTTTIWEFSMKCHLCPQKFIIRTDPENCDYAFVSGCRKREREFSAEDAETEKLNSEETNQRLASDPLFGLEHKADDKRKAKKKEGALAHLIAHQAVRHEDNYSLNCSLRKQFRKSRRELQALKAREEELGLEVALLPIDESDKEAAAKIKFSKPSNLDLGRKRRRSQIMNSSIFGGQPTSAAANLRMRAATKRAVKRINPRQFRLSSQSSAAPSGNRAAALRRRLRR